MDTSTTWLKLRGWRRSFRELSLSRPSPPPLHFSFNLSPFGASSLSWLVYHCVSLLRNARGTVFREYVRRYLTARGASLAYHVARPRHCMSVRGVSYATTTTALPCCDVYVRSIKGRLLDCGSTATLHPWDDVPCMSCNMSCILNKEWTLKDYQKRNILWYSRYVHSHRKLRSAFLFHPPFFSYSRKMSFSNCVNGWDNIKGIW